MTRLTLLKGGREDFYDGDGLAATPEGPLVADGTPANPEASEDFDAFSSGPPDVVNNFSDMSDSSLVGIGLSFVWAVEAAAGGNYDGALRWLRTVEDNGYEWSAVVHARRRTWLAALAATSPHPDALTAVPNGTR
jgi:hypothetical protein